MRLTDGALESMLRDATYSRDPYPHPETLADRVVLLVNELRRERAQAKPKQAERKALWEHDLPTEIYICFDEDNLWAVKMSQWEREAQEWVRDGRSVFRVIIPGGRWMDVTDLLRGTE
jgi:hypothetical protein